MDNQFTRKELGKRLNPQSETFGASDPIKPQHTPVAARHIREFDPVIDVEPWFTKSTDSRPPESAQNVPREGRVRELTQAGATSATDSTAKHIVSKELTRHTSLSQTIDQARKIIHAARADSERLIADARAIAEQEKKSAWEEGYSIGRQEAISTLLNATRLRKRLFETIEKELLSVTLLVAEEVIGEAISAHPESILARIRRALKDLRESIGVTLVVHPHDAQIVHQALDELQRNTIPGLKLSLHENNELKPGNARLETDLSVIEASIDHHLQAIRETLCSNSAQILLDHSLVRSHLAELILGTDDSITTQRSEISDHQARSDREPYA